MPIIAVRATSAIVAGPEATPAATDTSGSATGNIGEMDMKYVYIALGVGIPVVAVALWFIIRARNQRKVKNGQSQVEPVKSTE